MNLQDSFALLETCPFCEHNNLADSKFCNHCGGALHLVPCPRCGAVSDVTATSCYQCHGRLPGRGDTALTVVPQTDAAPPRSLRRTRTPAIVGAAIFAVIALVSTYTYRQASHSGDRGSPEVASASSGEASGADKAAARPDKSTRPAGPDKIQSTRPLAGAVPAATKPASGGYQKGDSGKARVAPPRVTHTRGTYDEAASEKDPSRPAVCTAAVAALGLCALKPPQRIPVSAAETSKPVVASSNAGDPGKAGRQGALRQDACTERAAALGLCTPRIPVEGR